MKDIDRIKHGDIVSVNCNAGQCTISHSADVLYMPCSPHESWIFRDRVDGAIIYVSEGCTVTKRQ